MKNPGVFVPTCGECEPKNEDKPEPKKKPIKEPKTVMSFVIPSGAKSISFTLPKFINLRAGHNYTIELEETTDGSQIMYFKKHF